MARKSDKIRKADAERVRLDKLKTWRDQEISRQSANRFQMQLDEDFYDGLQRDTGKAAESTRARAEPVVYNEIKPNDRLAARHGTQDARIDFKVTPDERDDGANEDRHQQDEAAQVPWAKSTARPSTARTPFARA